MLRAIINFFRRIFGTKPVEYGLLTGSVKTGGGLPIRQATVICIAKTTEGWTPITATTGSFGLYEMSIPLDREYTLEAHSARYTFSDPQTYKAGYLGPIDFVAKERSDGEV